MLNGMCRYEKEEVLRNEIELELKADGIISMHVTYIHVYISPSCKKGRLS